MSRVSAPRTSPTTIRSGRMRSDSRTRSRRVTAPSPSRFGCRHCIATTSGRSTRSSKTSSHVTMRSRAGTAARRQFSSVVLPAPTAPATTTDRPACTEASRNRAAAGEHDPRSTSSAHEWARRPTNLRTLTDQWSVIGGIATCSRLPSGRRASTNGCARSRRRPARANMRSTISSTSRASRTRPVSSCSPLRATKTRPGSLTQISSTSGSSISGVSAPKPRMRWRSRSTSCSASGGRPPSR